MLFYYGSTKNSMGLMYLLRSCIENRVQEKQYDQIRFRKDGRKSEFQTGDKVIAEYFEKNSKPWSQAIIEYWSHARACSACLYHFLSMGIKKMLS